MRAVSSFARRRFLKLSAAGTGLLLAGQQVAAAHREIGAWASLYGERSPYETTKRKITGNLNQYAATPFQNLSGTITPSSLHFERHHGGIPDINPEHHKLLIHGMVEKPLTFTLDALQRMPQVSRICFVECAGNGQNQFLVEEKTLPQTLCGLMSQSEWTGVSLESLLREAGVSPKASWLLVEGGDACLYSRSLPMDRAMSEAIVAYAQNGEAVRPGQGYPLKLIVPGCEGSVNIKWLRRIEVSDQPFMTREETSKYSDPLRDGTVRQFSLVMDAKSMILRPSFPFEIEKGWHEIRGLAWSGRGKIRQVEISDDGGKNWVNADVQFPVRDKALTSFGLLWNWDGQERVLLSRATDDTGYIQPSVPELIGVRGKQSLRYHNNSMVSWRVQPDGQVLYHRVG